MAVTQSTGRKFLFAAGDHIGDFTVVSAVGRGSYGEVYYVSDPLGARFALKVILETISDVSAREINGISLLRTQIRSDESLPRIYHIGRINDLLYYTMDAADNCSDVKDQYLPDTLQHRIDKGQSFSADEILEIAKSLLKSIQALHQRDLVHRDIKPSNIIFLQGQCVLTDFGLISANPETFIGSPGFLAPCPEGGVTLQNQKVADLYSLGKIIYCLFSGNSVEHFPLLQKKFSVQDFSIIRPLYQKACAADCSKRFQSADEFYAAVVNARFAGKNKKLKKIFLAAGVFLLFLVALALIFIFMPQSRTPDVLTSDPEIKEKSGQRPSADFPRSQEAFVKIFDKDDGYRILVCFAHSGKEDADPLYRPNQFKAMGFLKKGMANHLDIDPQTQKVKIKFIRYLRQPFSEGALMVYIYFINKKDCEVIYKKRRGI